MNKSAHIALPKTSWSAIVRPGTTLAAPGKDLTFLPSAEGRLRFREDVGPDAMPVPLHVHLRQTERFTAIDGRLRLIVAERQIVLEPGESAEVPPGTPHTYAPAESLPVLIEVALWPVNDGGRFFETIYGLTREHRLPPKGLRDALALAAFCHSQAFYFAGSPLALQRPMAGLGAALAALLRIDPWAPRYSARPAGSVPLPHIDFNPHP
jgi:mannose-6-phosphate isomerase-like protein (cupin superfamily)